MASKNNETEDCWGEGKHFWPYTFQFVPGQRFQYTPLDLPIDTIGSDLKKKYEDLAAVWGKDKVSYRVTTSSAGVDFQLRITNEANDFHRFEKKKKK